MSSISKADLINCLEGYPDDAEVIFELKERVKNPKTGKSELKCSLAFINGIMYDKDFNEIHLMN